MTILTILFTLSLLSSAAMAETYCYYNGFGDIVCRDRLSTAARIAIAVTSFVVVFAILLIYAIYRRRRIARANMAFVHAPQQQGHPTQYPPPPPGGFPGVPLGGNRQKTQEGYDPQQYNAQYNAQYNGQYDPQYNGQHHSQYSAPQYPPTAYDQGNPNQAAPPYPGYGPPPGPPPQQQGYPHNV